MSYVDLHFHLLPGVDDGPVDMEASLELARAAVGDGTGTVVATPHVRPNHGVTDAVEIHARVLELRFALAAADIALEVRCGGELGHEMVGRMRQSELELLAQGPSGARWVLLETPFHGIAPDFHDATAELRDRGFGVLMAHPERSADASLDGAAGLRTELERRLAGSAERAVPDRRSRGGRLQRGVGAGRRGPDRGRRLRRPRPDPTALPLGGPPHAPRGRHLAPRGGVPDRLDPASPAGDRDRFAARRGGLSGRETVA